MEWKTRRSPANVASRNCGALLALAVLALLALPNTAGASHRSEPRELAGEFTLQASHGYRITVSGEAVGQEPGTITLTADRTNDNVQYIAAGTITPTEMKASFGKLGRISLRFKATGKLLRTRLPACGKSQSASVVKARRGTFVGTISFQGEKGYTRLAAHRAKGVVGNFLAFEGGKVECGGTESPQNETGAHLEASQGDRRRSIGFSAFAEPNVAPTGSSSVGAVNTGDDSYLFEGISFEKLDHLIIERTVGTSGPAADFIFDSALSSAAVAPPAPFTGSATFHRNTNRTTTWTGSLGVSFPGLGPRRLAGPQFKSGLEPF